MLMNKLDNTIRKTIKNLTEEMKRDLKAAISLAQIGGEHDAFTEWMIEQIEIYGKKAWWNPMCLFRSYNLRGRDPGKEMSNRIRAEIRAVTDAPSPFRSGAWNKDYNKKIFVEWMKSNKGAIEEALKKNAGQLQNGLGVNKKISNQEKNKGAQILLINKLQQLGADNVQPVTKNHRKFIECSIEGNKKIIYYNSKTKGDWQLNLNHSEDCDPSEKNNRFWILIDVTKNKYFVTPERWLAKNIYDEFEKYKQKHGGSRPKNDYSKHHKKSEYEIKQWEEAWDVIFEQQILFAYDDEIQQDSVYIEGSVTSIKVNSYERNQAARRECLNSLGHTCVVCGFNFKEVYGEIGDSFIHVHHKVELSSIKETYLIDPKNDLVPVCPNCHAMLHKKKPTYSIEELKNIVLS